MGLNAKQLDRAVGALVGAAAGDALGVPYEYGSRPLPGPGEPARMLGGGLGGYEPGQWSDDTEMACVIVQARSRTPTIAALYGARLRSVPVDTALADGCTKSVLPKADPIKSFRDALHATQSP
ncbi:ADP-ribosylglycohydrolase family protein [Amycolatopsis sp. NPDC051128]|uniref:ADP-ribosylglycohydrolase family protein n=1 Tax=Amycolatopsis sp. NPDC051128 TaxID=3155412 RepID=UPI003442D9C8